MKNKKIVSLKRYVTKIDAIGTHYIIDFFGVEFALLDDEKQLKKIMRETIKQSNNKLIRISSFKFKPQGVTMIALLKESHLSFHTYPELNYIAIDLFTCGKSLNERAYKHLISCMKPQKIKVLKLERGKL